MSKRIRLLVNVIFTATVVAFCVLYVLGVDWRKVSGLRVDVSLLFLSLIAGVLYLFLASFVWVRMLYRLNPAVRFNWDLLAVYAKSWMGRYVPGKVLWIAGKIHFASQYDIPASQLGITSIVDAGVQMATKLLISLVIVLADGHFAKLPEGARVLTYVAIAGLVLALFPPVFNAATKLVLRITKRKVVHNIHLSYGVIGEMTGLYLLGYLLLGATYFFSLKAVLPDLDPSLFAFTTAGISIAVTLGSLALFAPSGLGVREGFTVLFLSMAMPVGLAVVSAVALRVMALATDLGFLAACQVGRAFQRKLAKV